LKALTAAAGGAPVRLGLSLPRADLTGVADAYHQAVLAVQTAPEGGGLAWFDRVDPVYWVLKQQPTEDLVTLRDLLVGPGKRPDDAQLGRALAAYPRAPNDLGALAEELHVRVHALRYRLTRV